MNKTIDLFFADDQGRQDLDDVGIVGGNLSEDSVFLQKRGHDHLREEAFVHGVNGLPSEFEFQGAGLLKFDSDHQAFSADFRDDVMFFLKFAEAGHELFASKGGVLNEVFVFGHVEAGQPASHGEIVATEGGGVGDAAIKAGKDALVDGATHNDGGAGDVATGQGFGHGDDIGIKVPMLETEPFSGTAHRGLDFVGNKESSVFTAKFLSGGEVVVGRVLNSFSLDGFKDEGSDLARFQFFFEIGEVAELYKIGAREEGAERFAEIAGVGNGEGSKG